VGVSIDGGLWYDKKVEQSRRVQPPTLSTRAPFVLIVGWKPITSCKQTLPAMFNEGHIYHYIVEQSEQSTSATVGDVSCNSDSSDDGGTGYVTAKQLRRGRTYFTSGHVQDVSVVDNVSSSDYYFVKGKVRQSMGDTTYYTVTFTLSMNSGFIIDVTCDCKASALGRCSHITALLFALLDFKVNVSSCTSRKCQWNVGRKRGKPPSKVHEVNYRSRAKRKPGSLVSFDLRPEQFRETKMSDASVNNFRSALASSGSHNAMWLSILPYHYGDYTYSEADYLLLKEKVSIISDGLLPLSICVPVTMCTHAVNCSLVTETAVQVAYEQSSDAWFAERYLRITASNGHDVFAAADKNPQRIFNR